VCRGKLLLAHITTPLNKTSKKKKGKKKRKKKREKRKSFFFALDIRDMTHMHAAHVIAMDAKRHI